VSIEQNTSRRSRVAGEPRRVFILGGGAVLGAHQVGALKYLEEIGIKPDVLICSSIGVINGCVYGSGGIVALEELWQNFRSLPVMLPSWKDNPFTGYSLVSMRGMAGVLEEFMDFPKLLESEIDIEVIVLNLSRGEGQMWSSRDCENWRELRELSRAGWALPPVFPPVVLRGEYFIDGGLAWNIPLEHALACDATEIYVLAPIASKLPYKHEFGSILDYFGRMIDVLWRTLGNMGHLYARIDDGTFHDVPVTIIEPTEHMSGFSIFNLLNSYPEKSRRMIAAGYRDAKRALERPEASLPQHTRRVG
jgi:predicted acylesterase/phospholipase RssA